MAPTLAQLEAEIWWRQELVTYELDWLVDNLCSFFNVGRDHGGTKGDRFHLNGGHRSQAWILHSQFCTNRTYTVQAGLNGEQERWIAAFDITLSNAQMKVISENANRVTRAGQLEELVEWFGNLFDDAGNVQRVDGWDNIRNKIATSDDSHLWHFHGRILRSLLNQMLVMVKIFNALTGQSTTPPKKETFMALSDFEQDDMYRRIKNVDKILWYGVKGGENVVAEVLTAGTGKGTDTAPGEELVAIRKLNEVHAEVGGSVDPSAPPAITQEQINVGVANALADPAIVSGLVKAINDEFAKRQAA